MAPTYDPQTGLFYVNARDQCDIFSTAPQPYEAGHAYYGSAYFPSQEAEPYRGFRAIDPATGEIKWEFEHASPTWSGVLSTAGGLVFSGDAEGNFIAFDAAPGKPLWHFQTGGGSMPRRWPSPWMGKNMLPLRRAARCMRSGCRELSPFQVDHFIGL